MVKKRGILNSRKFFVASGAGAFLITGVIAGNEVVSAHKDVVEVKEQVDRYKKELGTLRDTSEEKINSLSNEVDSAIKAHNEMVETYSVLQGEYELNLEELNSANAEIDRQQKQAIEEAKKAYELKQKEVDSVVVQGGNDAVAGDYSGWTKMNVESTAYTTYENGDLLAGAQWGNLTASGKVVQYGHIAVDTSVIPLGTMVYIPKLGGVFEATDTGSAIKGNIIDIYFDSLEQCTQWGRQNIEIYVNY